LENSKAADQLSTPTMANDNATEHANLEISKTADQLSRLSTAGRNAPEHAKLETPKVADQRLTPSIGSRDAPGHVNLEIPKDADQLSTPSVGTGDASEHAELEIPKDADQLPVLTTDSEVTPEIVNLEIPKDADQLLVLTTDSEVTPEIVNLEISKDADQPAHPALKLIAARRALFARQGSVVATWRRRGPAQKLYGPYYSLIYREDGRQRSVYLGRVAALVQRVRGLLAALRKPLVEFRLFERLRRQGQAALRAQKLRTAALLRPLGLRLKGFEVRGWRVSFLRRLLPPRRPLLRPA
jgi:hypothetical protein